MFRAASLPVASVPPSEVGHWQPVKEQLSQNFHVPYETVAVFQSVMGEGKTK